MRYVVRFYKSVLGENGRVLDRCQQEMEIDAADEGAALQGGKQSFCQRRGLTHWSLHADRYTVSEARYET